MPNVVSTDAQLRRYRINRFLVPSESRSEFLVIIQKTSDMLGSQPGFIQDFVLENASQSDVSEFVTMIEFENQEVIPKISDAVAAFHESMHPHPRETLARLGVTAEQGIYKRLQD